MDLGSEVVQQLHAIRDLTGDPIFTRLADRARVGFAYHVDSRGAVALEGDIRVDAILSGSGGWKRSCRCSASCHRTR